MALSGTSHARKVSSAKERTILTKPSLTAASDSANRFRFVTPKKAGVPLSPKQKQAKWGKQERGEPHTGWNLGLRLGHMQRLNVRNRSQLPDRHRSPVAAATFVESR